MKVTFTANITETETSFSNQNLICMDILLIVGYKVLAINTPFLAKNLQGSGNGGSGPSASGSSSSGKLSKKAAKKRKFEERANEILTSSTLTSNLLNQTTIPNPLTSDWINQLEGEHKNVRILQRLTIIFDEVKYLNAVVCYAYYLILIKT